MLAIFFISGSWFFSLNWLAFVDWRQEMCQGYATNTLSEQGYLPILLLHQENSLDYGDISNGFFPTDSNFTLFFWIDRFIG